MAITMTSAVRMSGQEKRSAAALALIYAIRMFGLFTLLPVLSLYGRELLESTPVLVGLAIGIYGLTQAFLQIPLGILSDHWGRKRVISLGLCLFMAGSAYAALTTGIYDLILARALQGAGAVAAVVMALAADLSREQHRTKMMASIGASIGASFILALIIGPLISTWLGVPGLFWMITSLGALALVILWLVVPAEPAVQFSQVKISLWSIFKDSDLMRLNLGILVLHLLLTASFFVIPL